MKTKRKKPLVSKNCCIRKHFWGAAITAVLLIFWASPIWCQVPSISSFSPARAATGMTVTITGTNFTGTTQVSFGGIVAASFTIVSATQITAVVGTGNSGNIAVTNGSGTGSRSGFFYQSLSRIITDFGGYWNSTTAIPNSTQPDSSHHLLAFTFNNTLYATGANNAVLNANGLVYTNSIFRAIPVASISGNNPGGSVYLSLARKVDGSLNVAHTPNVAHYNLRSVLTDGLNGLNLGTGFTNLPNTATISFAVNRIVVDKIADEEPDIVITQIAAPSSGNDVFSFIDANGNLVGNTVTQDMTHLASFGTYQLDLFNMTPGAPFNLATAYSAASANTTREIRLVAFKLSDFGITAGNAAQVRAISISPSSNSDYAFIAYNTASIVLPPNVTENLSNSQTNICSGGTAQVVVIATAAEGGALSFTWEQLASGGSVWQPVSNGGGISGATSAQLRVNSPANGHKYRAIVTESTSALADTSNEFTITLSSPTAPSAVSISGNATVCLNTATQITSIVTGGSNLYYQWQSSTSSGGVFTNITGANQARYEPPVNSTGTMFYRVQATSGHGCTGTVTSSTSSITVTGISTVTPATRCSSGTLNLAATATSGTIDWYADDATATVLATGTAFTTPSLNNTTTYFVTSSGCASALRVPVAATVLPLGRWMGSANGDWNTAANWCGGVPTSSTNVLLPTGITANIASAHAEANSINLLTGSSLVMSGSYNLTITAGGNMSNSGSFDASASDGKIIFAGNGSITGNITLKNIDANGALNFGTGSTVSGQFTLQSGGSVTGNAPVYSCPSASLVYNTGGVFNRGLEWQSAASGRGYPANVLVQNNTTINFPAGGNGFVCNDVTIAPGAAIRQNFSGGNAALRIGRHLSISGTLELGSTAGGDLELGGNWLRNNGGSFSHNGRRVTFTGTNNFSGRGTSFSTIQAPASSLKDNEGGFGGENFGELYINKASASDSVLLQSPVTITRSLGLTQGTLSLGNHDVTIVSNSSRTAYVAPVSNIAAASVRYGGTGRFVIQRFIQNPTAVRSWRLLTAPLQANDAPSINQAWQESSVNPNRIQPNADGGAYNPWPGYGTHITGPGGIFDFANGFDHGTNAASILHANSTLNGWLIPASTKATLITDQPGWMLFVRGDRGFTIGNQYTPAQNTTLQPRGKINLGTLSRSLVNGRQVVGNPYPSAISLRNVSIGGMAGKECIYYMWDPKMFVSFSQPGKWVTFAGDGDYFDQTSSSTSYGNTGRIESGQAFVVDAPNGGQIEFKESDKLDEAGSLIGIANRPSDIQLGNMAMKIRTDMLVNTNNGYQLTDGVLSLFASRWSNAVNEFDGIKIGTFGTRESLGLRRGSSILAIEKRAMPLDNDTIFLHSTRLNALNYRFVIDIKNSLPIYQFWLHDKFLGNATALAPESSNRIDFAVTADAASQAADRFMITMRPAQVLPVKFGQFEALLQQGKGILRWNILTQESIKQMIVEKSIDGTDFTPVANLPHISIQSWKDLQLHPGKNFYRIKCITHSGEQFFSEVRMLEWQSGDSQIVLYPNPISNNNIQFYFTNAEPGRYHAEVYSANGKLLHHDVMNIQNREAKASVSLEEKLPTGTYPIKIIYKHRQIKILKAVVK